ncbi:MAG: alpha-L-fucosidase [Mycobacteriales bacterium]
MRIRRNLRTPAALLAAGLTASLLSLYQPPASAAAPPAPIPVPLDQYYSNDGIDSAAARGGDFDGSGYSYPAEQVPAGGTATVGGLPFRLGPATAGADNDVVALGQDIALPAGRYVAAAVLGASSYGATGGTATVHYADGSTTTATLGEPDWYSGDGPLHASFRYSPDGADQHPVSLYLTQVWIDPSRDATAITLPTTAAPAAGVSSLHVFAMTLQPVAAGRAVALLDARSTTKQLNRSGHPQAVAVTVENVGTDWIDRAHPLTVTVQSGSLDTVAPATVDRLLPGETATVEVGVRKHPATLPDGLPVGATIRATVNGRTLATTPATLKAGIPAYTTDDASLSQHESPDWYNDAKFGIFIHWGVYSVPAWAPVGGTYAEWYWNSMNSPGSPTYLHHEQTYGQDFNYDDFIPRFTAAKFDPKAWVRLFTDAGAKYFVLTSKHHEGFTLFDTATTRRGAVDMGPHQDLVGELFAAARKYTPNLHPGLYYSLPEWYNPAGPWYGHGPQNPYTGQSVPYTGQDPAVTDYVHQIQAPQMHEIVDQYHPDVLWCDIGGANESRGVFADYFNSALVRGQQVTVDNRCGIPEHDFTTPEYTTYPDTVVQKWESSRGLDPHSYGYNAQTPDDAYMTADQVVDSLVDIVSKNGNFLLDIGPRADGTIPEIMQTRLRETGAWLKVNGEAIYGTTYWSRMAQQGDLRFTVKPNKAFYLTSLVRPGSQVVVDAPVPIRAGDTVSLLGYRGGALHWTQAGGRLVIDVPPAAQQSGRYAWTFKIAYRG